MKRALPYAAGKLLRMLLLLGGVSLLTFMLVSASPVNPLQANLGQTTLGSLSDAQIVRLEAYWGMDQPPLQRFLAWAGDFLRGDMGVSLVYRREVSAVIAEKLAYSLPLMLAAWAISGALGALLGLLAAAFRGRAADRIIRGYALLTASTPAFWLALLLLIVFGVWLKVLPIGLSVPIGREAEAVSLGDRFRHAILPTLTLSVTGMSSMILHTREKAIDVLGSEYALFALARGESRASLLRRHVPRNVLLPVVTLQCASIGEIFGGSVLVEQVFSYPGLGQAAVSAGLGGDVSLLLGITVISAALVFFGNFIADMLYGVIDPRMRREGRHG